MNCDVGSDSPRRGRSAFGETNWERSVLLSGRFISKEMGFFMIKYSARSFGCAGRWHKGATSKEND